MKGSKFFLYIFLIFLWCFCGVLVKADTVSNGFHLTTQEIPPLLRNTTKALCTYRLKVLHVYFDKAIKYGGASYILQELNECGISYISMRSRGPSSPLPAIKDDGIRVYLLMVLHKATHFIEISIIKKHSAAKHLSHVLIIIEESSHITETWLKETFRKFWSKWFINVAIIFSRNSHLQIYRYNPFAENILIKVKPQGQLPRLDELFPKRLPNLEGKPLRMCLYNDNIRAIFHPDGSISGSDGLMSSFIASQLNATKVVHRVTTYGYENKTADLCFRETLTAVDDLALNTRFLSLPNFQNRVESTIVHRRDDLCVLVPKAKLASTFWNLFRAYNIPVWCCILLSLLLAYWFFHLSLMRTCRFRQGLLLNLFAGTLTMPLVHEPSRFSLRLFLFCWLIYSLLICSAFRGTLTSNLVFRESLPDIDTLKDLALAPYKLAMIPRHMKHLDRFLNMSNRYEAMIKKKVAVMPDQKYFEALESNNLSFAYLQKLHMARFHHSTRRHMSRGRPLYHVMETCLVPFHAVFIVPYGSPYLGALNTLIRSSHEFGFSQLWESIMKAAFIKSGKTSESKGRNDGDPVVLKLPHLRAAFCFWGCGLTIAFTAFLCEKFGSELRAFNLHGIKVKFCSRRKMSKVSKTKGVRFAQKVKVMKAGD